MPSFYCVLVWLNSMAQVKISVIPFNMNSKESSCLSNFAVFYDTLKAPTKK